MRDPHKLSAFQLADQLAIAAYKHTAGMRSDKDKKKAKKMAKKSKKRNRR